MAVLLAPERNHTYACPGGNYVSDSYGHITVTLAADRMYLVSLGASELTDLDGTFVTPDAYRAAGDGVTDDTAALRLAIAAASASGATLLIARPYRHTQKITWPAGISVKTVNPGTNGFVCDVATDVGHLFSGGEIVENFAVWSAQYPASAIADTSAWDLGQRSIRPGSNSVWRGKIVLHDLAGGFDLQNVSNVYVERLEGTDLRSRRGWAAVFHAKQSTDVLVQYVSGLRCDRLCEPEYGCKRIYFAGGGYGESIYPAGFTGQPANYDSAYSMGISVHSHDGEGACEDITYGGKWWMKDCLTPIVIIRSDPGTSVADLPRNIRVEDVTIENVRQRDPVQLKGINISIGHLRFTGTSESALTSYLIHAMAAPGTQTVQIDELIVDNGAWKQPVMRAGIRGTRVRSGRIGSNGGTTTRAYIFKAEADDCAFEDIYFDGATYATVAFDASTGLTGIRRTGTRYTAAGANGVGADTSANWDGNTPYEADNTAF